MKKNYWLLAAGMLLLGSASHAQCLQTTQYPTSTVDIISGGSTEVTTCNWAGEYSVLSFSVAGNYNFIANGGTGNFITVTDNSNNVLAYGNSTLGVAIPSVGVYRAHISADANCSTQSSCRTVSVQSTDFCTTATLSAGGTRSATVSSSTIIIDTCQTAGEYTPVQFTLTGNHTITAAGGTGNYITITNSLNTVVLGQGQSPVLFAPYAPGVYNIHLAASSPTACAGDIVCHTVTVLTPAGPPANDLCSNATPIAIGTSSAGTTILATTESPSPGNCGTTLSQPGVWFSVTGNGNQLGASLCSTAWDSKIFIYSGSCGALTCVTGKDDAGPMCSGSAASATWCSVSGVNYKILVTGYSTASNFTIAVTQTVPVTPTVAATISNATVCPSISTTLSASGANTYTWSTGSTQTNVAISPTVSNTYTVTGSDVTRCRTATGTVQVTVLSRPVITANSGSICPATVFTLAPSGAATYTFVGNSQTLTGVSATVSPITSVVYSVTGTGSNGCVSGTPVATSSITMFQTPTIAVVSTPTAICVGGSATLTATGANTFTWSNATVANSIVVSPSSNTTYTVTGTGTNICNGVRTGSVLVNQLPNISVNSGTVCLGRSFTMTPSGASTYTYSSGSNVVTPTGNTSYSVAGTSAAGCVSSSFAVASVSTVALPVVTVNSGTVCEGQAYYVTPTGAASYSLWGFGNPIISSVSGNYTVTGTSSVGCVSQPAVLSLTVAPLPNVTISGPTVTCAGTTSTLQAQGAVSYTWNTQSNNVSLVVTPTANSNYYVIGEDTTGCVNVANLSITVNPIPAVLLTTSKNLLCAGQSATLNVSGAASYTWAGGSNASSLVVSPSASTVYAVTGENTVGCTSTKTIAVAVSTIVVTLPQSQAICEGKSTTLSVTGASSHTWSTGSPFASIVETPSATTNYTVGARDANQCYHSANITVTVNPNPVVSASASPTMICTGESATLTATGASSVSWSNQMTGTSIVVSPTIHFTYVYIATGVDNNGCSDTAKVSLVVDRCTGIAEVMENIFSVYPNPSTGMFNVHMKQQGTIFFEVTDVSGRIIESGKTVNADFNLDIREHANGLYYLRVRNENGAQVLRIVKE